MKIEYIKIKSFGSVDNLKVEPGEFSPLTGKGELGLAALTAFQLFIFYGTAECEAEVLPYLQSAKGPVAGGYAALVDGDRRYIVAREYFNGEERMLVKDADTDIEINIPGSAGAFFFSRSAAEFMHGSEGAPVDISDILKTSTIKIDAVAKQNANEILMLRDRLDSLGKKQMRLGAESMAARGINPAERLRRARDVQKALLENDRELKNIDSEGAKPTVMKKTSFVSLFVTGGIISAAGLIVFLLMSYMNIDKAISFFIALALLGIGGSVMLWLGLFKLVEKLIMKNVPDSEQVLLARRAELSEKLDILLEGSDFEELEKQAASGENVGSGRTSAEIERDLENVRREMDEVRAKLNEKLSV